MRRKKYSLKGKVLGFLFASWLLPILMMIIVFIYYLVSHHYQNVSNNLMEQLAYNVNLCMERLDNCTDGSRQATYDRVIQNAYNEYMRISNRSSENPEDDTAKDANAYDDYRRKVNDYMAQEYSRSEYFQNVIFFMQDNPSRYCYTFSTRAGGSQRTVTNYWQEDHDHVLEFASTLDTNIGFYENDGRLYLVRNMVDTSFQTMGVLVMRLNDSFIFGNLHSMPWTTALTMDFAGYQTALDGDFIDELGINKGEPLKGSGQISLSHDMYIYYTGRNIDYTIRLIMQVDREAMMNPFYGYPYVMAGVFIMMIPLSLFFIRTYQTHVTQPVKKLMDGAAEIEKGNLGFQMENQERSQEFYYLEESFNSMSRRLKQQFDHIYQEEIAIRDARIMALQSHINPHFMNNTLEIINWEARLNGDVKVSKMIEALGTLMDAAIDRKKRSVIRLAEEMIYVNSYLYITTERLGKRLTVEQDLPKDIMDIFVPRLILQPVIENAIEHGIIPNRKGTVRIHGQRVDDYLYLDIINDGTMSDEDREHIHKLLDNDYDTSQESSGSMGIANVNQRLRIIYGDECGLSLEALDESHVRARLKIRILDETQQPE